MIVFDFIFYVLYIFYTKSLKERHSELYAAGAVGLLQSFNVMSILYFAPFVNMRELQKLEYIGVIGGCFVILNFVRYAPTKRYKFIIAKFDGVIKRKKRILKSIVIIYVVSTISLYVLSLVHMS